MIISQNPPVSNKNTAGIHAGVHVGIHLAVLNFRIDLSCSVRRKPPAFCFVKAQCFALIALILPDRSKLELSLRFPASVICKFPLQSFFSREDRCDQDRALDDTDHEPHHAYRRIRAAVQRYLYQHCRDQHDPACFPPSPAAVLICKAPCFGISHGSARPVSDERIYFLRTVLPHQPSAEYHNNGIYHIADEHKPPHRHIIGSFPTAFPAKATVT